MQAAETKNTESHPVSKNVSFLELFRLTFQSSKGAKEGIEL
jgi:hypothetical protein